MKEVIPYFDRIQNSLRIVINKMQPKLLESMKALGVTSTQLFVLGYLKKQGSCKVTQLAEMMDVKPSAVTLLVDRLEENGLVLREHDKKDRRVVNISLTEHGDEKLKKVMEERKAIGEQYLSHLTEEELLVMATLTEKLAQVVNVEN
ncbi:MarR family winged helix-turn-helix transcriptional regulator [Neobacillus massiliamazoniensis]|uniref:MarR family transcriptional regulator n=1 Tax=Neobacillus massiliamazoniensis TaxID=1499688 RepID=A0A0U1NS17_9BACI|nr:MarR family transcriptional regulator [Neobacillus massiliamazoniensis]CRK80814.1 MarR family transcriptional regulator [Neobacillus massiliamazoniensis]